MTVSLQELLVAHFNSVFEGPNGDYPAVLEIITGMDASLAAWKPETGMNSIWQIVDHLTDSKKWQIEMLEKGRADPPEWMQPDGSQSGWQAAQIRLRETHGLLMAALRQIPEDRLLACPGPEEDQTLMELLLSIAAHEAHHCGQIDYLKGLRAEHP